MYKIKSNVKLKELTKYGFKSEGGELYYFVYEKYVKKLFNWFIVSIYRDKVINISKIYKGYDLIDIPEKFHKYFLKDLIQAGLVEKVSD